MENTLQLVTIQEDQPPACSRVDLLSVVCTAVALDAGPLVLHKQKDISAEARKDRRGGVSLRASLRAFNVGKGKGRKGGNTSRDITIRRSSRPTMGDQNPRETTVRKGADGVTRSQTCSRPFVSGNGTKGSPSGAGPTRYAPPWWSGTGCNAATWLSPPLATTRTMGVLGYNAGDPLKCMSNLIQGRMMRRQVLPTQKEEGKRRIDELLETDEVQLSGPKRGSFEAVMDILQGKEKLKQAKRGPQR